MPADIVQSWLNRGKEIVCNLCLIVVGSALCAAAVNGILIPGGLVGSGLTALALNKGITLSQPPFYTASSGAVREEYLVYEFTWEGIPAARGTWTACRRREEDKVVVEVKGRAETLKPVDVLWDLQAKVKAIVGTTPVVPQRFSLYKRENSRRRDTIMDFDHAAKTVRITRIGKHGNPRHYRADIVGQYDPVSAVFVLRGLTFTEGQTVTIDLQMGKDLYRVTLSVLQREDITVKAGTFRTVVIEPILYNVTKNEPSDLRRARLWISDDSRHIAVKAESEVLVGTVSAELIAQSETIP